MPPDVREILYRTAYRRLDMEKALDPAFPSFNRFDPELGYVLADYVGPDGMDGSRSMYRFEPGGQRKMINFSDRPCRINTYGDSFTMCQQVSDGETWQEILAAHLREPIRNFGAGGYGVYQSYLRAMRAEASDELSAEYIILNIWGYDHLRSLDAARWVRSEWDRRDTVWAADKPRQIHGFPWAHLRYDLDRGGFVERPGHCKTVDDLSRLCDPETFYQAFKDDSIVHLFCLQRGGEAPTGELEAIAEALGVQVDLRDPQRRAKDAERLHICYGHKATEYILDRMRPWAEARGKKIMIILSYSIDVLRAIAEGGRRPDQEILDYLDEHGMATIDCAANAIEDRKSFAASWEGYFRRYYIAPADAAVFGHYSPAGNSWFAFSIKDDVVAWLDPKPPAYRP